MGWYPGRLASHIGGSALYRTSTIAFVSACIALSADADELHVPSQYPTIQSAIDAATDGDEIVIAEGVYRELLDGQNKSLTYTGAGMGLTVLSGDLDEDGVADGDVLTINTDTATVHPTVTVTGIGIERGVNGIIAEQLGSLSIDACAFRGQSARAIQAEQLEGTVAIADSEFTGNDQAIYAWGEPGDVLVFNSRFADNMGVLRLYDANSLVVWNCVVEDNHEFAIAVDRVGLHIIDSRFENNTRNGWDSNYLGNKEVIITGCEFVDNSSDRDGGAISFESYGRVVISDSIFTGNSSPAQGGAVYGRGQSVTIINCDFSDNTAGVQGGSSFGAGSAVSISNTGDLLVESCTFARNAGTDVGPLNISVTQGVIRNCNFAYNGYDTGNGLGVPSAGGAVCVESGSVLIDGCVFRENAGEIAGAVYNYQGIVMVRNSAFLANRSDSDGGAFMSRVTRNFLTGCTFIGNHAGGVGGAVSGLNGNGIRGDITACTFVDNTASAGAIAIARNSEQFINSLFLTSDDQYQIVDSSISDLSIGDTNLINSNPVVFGFDRIPNHGGDGWGDDPTTPDVDEGANDDFGDLRLTAHSPAIDAGSNADIPLDDFDIDNDDDHDEPITGAFDMDGNPRFVDTAGMPNVYPGNEYGGPIDLGAYEYQGQSCHADVNRDGSLTPTDFTAWIDAYNLGDNRADQNRDGDNTPTDFTAWIANYNAGCN